MRMNTTSNLTHPPLHKELLKVHDQLARRNNLSTDLIAASALVEKDFGSACIAAIATLGGLHAPLEQTMYLLLVEDSVQIADNIISSGLRVPGWGSSFAKDHSDPLFDILDSKLSRIDDELYCKIVSITNLLLNKTKKRLFPNAACYTAACCIINDIDPRVALKTLVQGRIEAWSEIYLQNYKSRLP